MQQPVSQIALLAVQQAAARQVALSMQQVHLQVHLADCTVHQSLQQCRQQCWCCSFSCKST